MLGFSAACEIKEGTSGTSSDGGAGGNGGSGDGGAGVGGAGGGTGGMGGAGGSAVACYDKNPGCAEYITLGVEDPWCDEIAEDPTPNETNPSYELYEKLALCTCGDPANPAVGGKCKDACKDEACAGKDNMAGGACITCIQDTAMGCGNEANACANDI